MNEDNTLELPEGWARVALSDVSEKLVDGSHNPPPKALDGLPMLSARNVQSGQIIFDEFRKITPKQFESEDQRTRVQSGDVLLTIVGSIGRVAVVPPSSPKFCLQRSVAVLRTTCFMPELLAYQLASPNLQLYLDEMASGSAQRGVYLRTLGQAVLTVPPLAEQRRLVAAVEAVLTKVNVARDRLNRVPSILKRFRQAVLSAACSGRLTAGNDAEFVPLDDPTFKFSTALHDPDLLAASRLESLPNSWQLPPLEAIRDETRGISYGVLKPGPFVENGIPLLRIVDIEAGVASVKNAHRIGPELSQQYNRTVLQGGEVLISLVGTIGRVATVPPELRGTNIHRNLGLIAPSALVDSRYLAFAMASDWVQKQIAFVTVGASQPLFNLGDLKQLLIPLPLLPEQQEIVRRVCELFALADVIEARLTDARQMANQLTQAVLAKAFRGELVPTEAALARREKRTYEPAADLLARIRAEREQPAAPKPARVRKPKPTNY